MSLETPFHPKSVPHAQRRARMDQIIALVRALHARGIIHGDIKPADFLLCGADDGRLRLCDFGEAVRGVDEDLTYWDGFTTTNYISPLRTRKWPDGAEPPPIIEDDMYGVGLLCVGDVYVYGEGRSRLTGGMRMISCGRCRGALQRGGTVDVGEIEDAEVREVVRGYLRCGGAKI